MGLCGSWSLQVEARGIGRGGTAHFLAVLLQPHRLLLLLLFLTLQVSILVLYTGAAATAMGAVTAF